MGQPVTVGAVLAAACAVAAPAVAAAAPHPITAAAVEQPVRLLADGDSILNIPLNLFQDIVNIPATEVAALNTLASSLMFTGNWWTPSATNLWGEDPGDPGHFMAIIDLLFPFKQISGLGAPEIDPVADANGTAGLGQQLSLLAAAELPVAGSCAAISCPPMVPMEPITGITLIDRGLAFLQALGTGSGFPLFDGWFKVPLSQLADGYTFSPDLIDPSAGVGPNGAVPDDTVFDFPGTHPGPDGENLLPWAGITFKMDLAAPFQNFYNSLLAPYDPTGFETVTAPEYLRALQAVQAGLVVSFNSTVPGSPVCPGTCEIADTFHLGTRDAVQNIANAWPGNPLIDHWLSLDTAGLANGPTAEQVDAAVAGLQLGIFQFTPATTAQINDALAEINPVLPKLLVNAGVITDPAYAAWNGSTPIPAPDLGGHDPTLVWGDLMEMLHPGSAASEPVTVDWDASQLWDGLFNAL